MCFLTVLGKSHERVIQAPKAVLTHRLKTMALHSPGCLRIHSVDQAGLELTEVACSASQALGLKACASMPSC